jgi:glyoxylase-like metal-dependent hydrolase (beta-lactamase superfamily II)
MTSTKALFSALTAFVALTGCATSVDTAALGTIEVVTLRHSYNNSHLVRRGDRAFLVDAGKPEDAPALLESIRAAGTDPASLSAVIITHGHADHVGAVPALQKLGVKVVVGKGDAAMVGRGSNDALCPTSFIARQRHEDDEKLPFEPFEPDVLVDGPLALEPLTGIPGWIDPLAGHTEGSLVVNVGENADRAALSIALVGDLVRGAIGGPGAEVHFYVCDLADNRRDISALLTSLAPNAQHIFPGHFGPLDREDLEDVLSDLPESN